MVDNPERILRRSNTPTDKGISHLQRASSLPTESVKGFTSFYFDKEIDQSFPRSRSKTELCQVLTSPKRPNTFRPTQLPSHLSPTPAVQSPVIYPIVVFPPLVPNFTVVFPNPPIIMASIFSPLSLPAQFHDLPIGYSQRIRTYGAEGDVSAQQHIIRFNDFCDLEEVDHEYAKIRLFAQSLTGEKWERKKNSLHLLTQYNNLR